MGVAWPPHPAAVAPASAPAQTEVARPPTPRDCPCPWTQPLAHALVFLCLSTNDVTPTSPAPTCSSFPGGQEGGGGDSSGQRPGPEMDCLPLQPGCPQGQGCELSEDPWFWALDGAWRPLLIKTSCPCLHIFITSKCQDLAPPSSELTSHCPPVGDSPLPRLVTEGVGQGWGFSLYIPCHTNPQVFSLVCF